MSSFSENFQRDEKTDTQYDDSAFSTFALGILLVFIVILLIAIIRRIFYKKEYTGQNIHNCQCECCKNRLSAHYKKVRSKNINFLFFLYIALLIYLIYLSYLCAKQVQKNSGKLKTFDPYEILEIEPTTDEKIIKKAYKKLALKYHPDKNPNNLQAKAKFIMIAKAYDSLTNEESKKNFEKYGNPDGPGSMRISVALPSFILEKKNHMPILILFVIFIIIVMPIVFLLWFNNVNEYDEAGNHKMDDRIFYESLNENILLKQMPFVVGLAREYNTFTVRAEEENALTQTYKANTDNMPKHKLYEIPPTNKKAICILYSFLNNKPMNYPCYQSDLEKILKPINIFITTMYKMCFQITMLYNLEPIHHGMKNFGYNCIKTIFEFSQNIHQRIPHYNNNMAPFNQLPFFTDEKIKLVTRTNRKVFNNNKASTFYDFINNYDAEKRKEILSSSFDNAQIDEINKAIDALPQYECKIDVFVEGFEDILIDDLVTFKITITRKNLKENEVLGVNHSCYYPEIFKEKVAICLLSGKNILYQDVVEVEKRVTEVTHQFPAKIPGKVQHVCEVIPLNYKGLDMNIPFEFTVGTASEKRKAHLLEIKKREVKKIEPSYFQQLLNQIVPINNDDEEEEDEEEDEKKKNEKVKGGDKEKNVNVSGEGKDVFEGGKEEDDEEEKENGNEGQKDSGEVKGEGEKDDKEGGHEKQD